MNPGVSPRALAAALLLLFLIASGAAACEACFGAADAPEVKGMNNAMLFLLGVIGLVQVGFVKLFWDFRQRARTIAERKEKFRIVQGGRS